MSSGTLRNDEARTDEIRAMAAEVLGSQEAAGRWMEEPAVGLDQRRPLDLVSTSAGVDIVKTFLKRMRYGVYT